MPLCRVAALLLSAPSLPSCVWYNALSGPAPREEGRNRVVLGLNLSKDFDSGTRALDFPSENTIDDIHVLVFNQNNNLVDIKPAERLTPDPGPDPGYNPGQPYSGRYDYVVTLPTNTGANTTRLVVLANSAAILAGTTGTDSLSRYIGRTYDEVTGALYDNLAGRMYPAATGRVPMWGETPQIRIAPGNNNHTVDVTRAVARIDVGVGQASWDVATRAYTWNGRTETGALIPFRITSVTVVRPNNRYAIVPARANRTGGSATAPTVPPGTSAYSLADSKTDFTFDTPTGYITYGIYAPEADIVIGAGGRPGDANHQNRMALVVGGNYDNSPATTCYRLDFAAGGDLINVLRNNLYMFNVASATGPGFATVDEAYASMSMNMTVDVLQWSEPNMGNIAFDGQSTLAVDKRQVTLFSNLYTTAISGDDNVVQIRTDVPAGWTVGGIVASDGTPAPPWVSVSPMQGPGGNTTTRMTVSVDANNSGAERTATLTLAAGRLRLPVRITQGIRPAISLSIVDGAGQEIRHLVFNNPVAGAAPLSQSFTVNWLPATNPVGVVASQTAQYEFPNPGGNPAVSDGAPYTDMPWPEQTGTKRFTVSPPALTAAELGANPFITKSSRFDMSVGNGFNTVTKSIALTQLQYNLRVEQAPGTTQNTVPANPMEGLWYAQIGGRRFTYNVRSNSNWTISAIAETRLSDAGAPLIVPPAAGSGDNLAVGATGTANTTPGGGTRELFTTSNTRRGNSGYADITYSSDPAGRFTSVVHRIFLPSAQFTVYGIVKMGDQNANFYNIFAGTNRVVGPSTRSNHLHPTINNRANFGTNLNGSGSTATPASTVFTSPVYVTGVNYNDPSNLTVTDINDAVAAGADMLYISGSTRFGDDVGRAIFDNFLARNKPVFLAGEDPASSIAILRQGVATGTPTNSTSALNGNAPVYQFYDIADPILEGPFRINGTTTLRGQYWGCDGIGSVAYSLSDASNMIFYSNATNQSGGTDSGYTGNNRTTCFRYTNYPFIFAADGGFAGTFDTSQTRTPAWTDNNGNPALKNRYGGGATKRNTANAFFVDNVIAWAIQRRTTQ